MSLYALYLNLEKEGEEKEKRKKRKKIEKIEKSEETGVRSRSIFPKVVTCPVKGMILCRGCCAASLRGKNRVSLEHLLLH